MPTLRINVTGLETADRKLRRLAAAVSDWRPFWRELGQTLADEAQQRWPLKRRSGSLRESLVWSGKGLGRGGVFVADKERLKFGTLIFYSRFAQHGAKRQRATPFVHVDAADTRAQLATWLLDRAARAGLEVEK